MIATPDPASGEPQPVGLMLAAEVQDHLLTASNDLDRLQTGELHGRNGGGRGGHRGRSIRGRGLTATEVG